VSAEKTGATSVYFSRESLSHGLRTGRELFSSSWIDLNFLFQKVKVFTTLKSTVNPGDRFEDTAKVIVTKSNLNFQHWL
jgi:hypothetical protein